MRVTTHDDRDTLHPGYIEPGDYRRPTVKLGSGKQRAFPSHPLSVVGHSLMSGAITPLGLPADATDFECFWRKPTSLGDLPKVSSCSPHFYYDSALLLCVLRPSRVQKFCRCRLIVFENRSSSDRYTLEYPRWEMWFGIP